MVFKEFDAVIDARTPSEYALDHIPGAISAPVLSDAERAEVGTLYKQVSPFDAKKLGAALIAKNVARHIEQLFREHDKSWRPLVYCWRGGKRSGAMAHILREVGWPAETLPGGYKAYRRWVVSQLEKVPEELRFHVVHGPTGSGKSRFLQALKAAGAQVLDLEPRCAATCRASRSRRRNGLRVCFFMSFRLSHVESYTWKVSRRKSATCRSPRR